jgi:N-acetylmuramoyl-L-alanine amidase
LRLGSATLPGRFALRDRQLGADAFPSPNFGSRREGAQPSLIVLHYTGMDSHAAALARLCDPAAEVSAHYLLDMDGTVTALVDEVNRAWHAGAGTWGAVSDVNSHSIGIEMTNSGSHPFSERQMAALETLLVGIMARWSIPPQGVIAHSDMAPSRKRDPGPRFDWRRLALGGLSVWPELRDEAPDLPFAQAARAFGYPDLPEQDLLAAFRLRFRPWAQGPLDGVETVLANDLARRFAVDASVPST